MIPEFEPTPEFIKKRNQVLSQQERVIIVDLLWKEIREGIINDEDKKRLRYIQGIIWKLQA